MSKFLTKMNKQEILGLVEDNIKKHYSLNLNELNGYNTIYNTQARNIEIKHKDKSLFEKNKILITGFINIFKDIYKQKMDDFATSESALSITSINSEIMIKLENNEQTNEMFFYNNLDSNFKIHKIICNKEENTKLINETCIKVNKVRTLFQTFSNTKHIIFEPVGNFVIERNEKQPFNLYLEDDEIYKPTSYASIQIYCSNF